MFDIDVSPSAPGAGDSPMRAHEEGALASFFADDPVSDGCSSLLPDATATSGSLRDGLVTSVAAFAYDGIPRKPARFDFDSRPIAIEKRDVEDQKQMQKFNDARALGTKKHHGNLALKATFGVGNG